jgi:hypothetical protein
MTGWVAKKKILEILPCQPDSYTVQFLFDFLPVALPYVIAVFESSGPGNWTKLNRHLKRYNNMLLGSPW